MLNIEPATSVLAGIVDGVGDDQLTLPTPCTGATVGDLLDHVDSFCQAFTAAATGRSPAGDGPPPAPDAARLGPDWRPRIVERLSGLAAAWRDPSAWTGMTRAGGQDLPGELAGVIALDEVIVHGWDIARATGQPYAAEPAHLEAVHGFVAPAAAGNPQGVPGLFGPAVPVPDGAPLLDRLLGLTGRDPAWSPPPPG